MFLHLDRVSSDSFKNDINHNGMIDRDGGLDITMILSNHIQFHDKCTVHTSLQSLLENE